MRYKMTCIEAANRIEDHMNIHKLNEPRAVHISEALELAVKTLRRVANGELKEIKHAHWEIDEYGHKCSHCHEYLTDDQFEYGEKTYCPSCNFIMDEKD